MDATDEQVRLHGRPRSLAVLPGDEESIHEQVFDGRAKEHRERPGAHVVVEPAPFLAVADDVGDEIGTYRPLATITYTTPGKIARRSRWPNRRVAKTAASLCARGTLSTIRSEDRPRWSLVCHECEIYVRNERYH